jgi:glycosyltransferase involved in cell wall biosynthesis
MYAPAKISAYMAAKKPIIAVLNGEGKEVVELAECGWNVPAGNAEQLANLVIKLSQTESIILKNKGENGYTFYEKFFSKRF